MQDSPLSITASVTGILTFAAAILAAIYVRYNTLRNGQLERATIQKSVEDSCGDLQMLSLDNKFVVKQDDEQDVIWLKKLGASLLATERTILVYCLYAQGLDKSILRMLDDDSSSLKMGIATVGQVAGVEVGAVGVEAGVTLGQAAGVDVGAAFVGMGATSLGQVAGVEVGPALVEVDAAGVRKNFPSKILPYLNNDATNARMLVKALVFILTFGSTPASIRWYQVRGKVLEKISERESLRTRMISHQVSMANSSSRKSSQALQQLLKQQAEFKAQLAELTRAVTMVNQGLVRPESVDNRDDTADVLPAASLGQPGSAQPSVNDEAQL